VTLRFNATNRHSTSRSLTKEHCALIALAAERTDVLLALWHTIARAAYDLTRRLVRGGTGSILECRRLAQMDHLWVVRDHQKMQRFGHVVQTLLKQTGPDLFAAIPFAHKDRPELQPLRMRRLKERDESDDVTVNATYERALLVIHLFELRRARACGEDPLLDTDELGEFLPLLHVVHLSSPPSTMLGHWFKERCGVPTKKRPRY
jgi:hypothetical protein